jgi:hypothetical protein
MCFVRSVQACQGNKFMESMDMHDGVEYKKPGAKLIPREADFLYAYSTVPGTVSVSFRSANITRPSFVSSRCYSANIQNILEILLQHSNGVTLSSVTGLRMQFDNRLGALRL